MVGTDFSEHELNTKVAIQKFIKHNYPKGSIGELLFKADAHRFGLTEALKIIEESDNKVTKYELIIIGDAKAKYNKFGLVSVTGEPFYCGHFIEPPFPNYAEKQTDCEARALVYAIRLCRDYCYYKGISFSDFTLHYLTDSQIVSTTASLATPTILTNGVATIRRQIPINIKTSWIRGVDNLADVYTLKGVEIVHPNYQIIDKYLTVNKMFPDKKSSSTLRKKEKI